MRAGALALALGLVGASVSGAVGPEPAGAAFENCRQAPADPVFDVTTESRASVYRLYCAYYLRYPDKGGFDYWMDVFDTGQMDLKQISDFFAVSSQEFINAYSTLTNAQFMDLIYANVMERAPDQEGYDYWLGQMNNGVVTRGYTMLLFSDSTEFRNKTGTVQVHYANCTEVRDAGAAPILRGQPGYGDHLDRDGDGIACEVN